MNLEVPYIPSKEGVCDTLAADSIIAGATLPNSGGVSRKIYVNSFSYPVLLPAGFC